MDAERECAYYEQLRRKYEADEDNELGADRSKREDPEGEGRNRCADSFDQACVPCIPTTARTATEESDLVQTTLRV